MYEVFEKVSLILNFKHQTPRLIFKYQALAQAQVILRCGGGVQYYYLLQQIKVKPGFKILQLQYVFSLFLKNLYCEYVTKAT